MALRRSLFISTSLVAFLAVFEVHVDAAPVPAVGVLPWNINNSSKLVVRPVWIMVPKDEVVVLFTDAVTSAAPSKASTTATHAPVTSSEEPTEPATVGHSTTTPYTATKTAQGDLKTTTDGAATESPGTTGFPAEPETTTDAPAPPETTPMEPSATTGSTADEITIETTETDPTEYTTEGETPDSEDTTSTDYMQWIAGKTGSGVPVKMKGPEDEYTDYTDDPSVAD